MTQTDAESRLLPLIHCARGILITPIPLVMHFKYLHTSWVVDHGPDITMAGPFGAIGFGISVAVLEFYYAVRLYEGKVDPLFRPLIVMIMAILLELALVSPPRLVENLVLSIHVSFVIGLSVTEVGLIALHF
ncbi:MAG: hypothetical protein EAX87_10880 [Candidatus Thorarchaeota archaeon]|nr:hypothetical protein [Candidatus Thorarchaeota archaeon]